MMSGNASADAEKGLKWTEEPVRNVTGTQANGSCLSSKEDSVPWKDKRECWKVWEYRGNEGRMA